MVGLKSTLNTNICQWSNAKYKSTESQKYKTICKEGKSAVRNTINELKEAKYIKISQYRSERGYYQYKYTVYRKPYENRDLNKNYPTPEKAHCCPNAFRANAHNGNQVFPLALEASGDREPSTNQAEILRGNAARKELDCDNLPLLLALWSARIEKLAGT